MPAPDLITEGDKRLKPDEPFNPANLGANPICSNCGDDLTMAGGILCHDCYVVIYTGGAASLEEMYTESIERAVQRGGYRVEDWSVAAVRPVDHNGRELLIPCDDPSCTCYEHRWADYVRSLRETMEYQWTAPSWDDGEDHVHVKGYFRTPQAERVQTEICIKCRSANCEPGKVACLKCYAISARMGGSIEDLEEVPF